MKLAEILSQGNGKDDFPVTCPLHVTKDAEGNIRLEVFPSCWINTKKHVFICFGCGAKGSLVKLKTLVEGISYEQAKWDLYKGEVPQFLIHSFAAEGEEKVDPVYLESFLAPYTPAGEISGRDISEESTRVYGILRDGKGNLYLPYRDPEGNLRGLQTRYHNPAEDTNWYDQALHFRRGQVLFGAQLRPEEFLILCEGAFDAAKLYDSLGVVSWAYNGARITPEQVKIIARSGATKILLWPDNDTTGESALTTNYWRLKRPFAGQVYTIPLQESDAKDPSDMTKERIRELWEKKIWVPAMSVTEKDVSTQRETVFF